MISLGIQWMTADCGCRTTYRLLDSTDVPDDSYIDYSYPLWVLNFDTLVANLSNLRELYLDGVDLSYSGHGWCTTLATYVPRLEILSMANCALTGPISKSLSRLSSLLVLNLQENYNITAGPFPEFLMDFINLTMLRLSNINLQGWFPSRPFQSKNLRVLDLSFNQNLTGHVPNFSNASSLGSLMLHGTSLLPVELKASTSFVSLKELSLDGNLVSVDFLSSFGTLGSLCKLDLAFDTASELGPVLSWIGHHKNITRLVIIYANFTEIAPALISNYFKTLRSLIICACTLPRHVLHAVGNLTGLQTLQLFNCRMTGSSTLPSSIGNLTNLRDLYIVQCGFSGPMPAAIGRLTNLRNMYVYSAQFSGPIPATIGKLTNLENLYIEDGISGPIPATIGNLTHLNSVKFFGEFSGPSIPYTIGQLSQLTRLNIGYSTFSESIPSSFFGSIPSSMANLTQLTELILASNSLNGEIPSFVFSLPVLRYLDLSNNQLSGLVQDFDTRTSQLERVDLSNNALSGFIPKAFFQLTSLVALDVSSNKFMGSLDLTQFWRLRELTILDLSNNELHVTDANDDNIVHTKYLTRLQHIGLTSCNITQFPRFLRHVKYITYLDLSCNKISGNVPNWLWDKICSIGPYSYLNLSHNMFTSMQHLNSDILPFNTYVEVLDLSYNRFSGRVPMPSSSGMILKYSNNLFSSLLPHWTLYLTGTSYLSISKNNINDHVPPSICDAQLNVLDLSNNNFYGSIPSCLMGNAPLKILNLRGNNFNGTLPSHISTRCTLQAIDLHGNKIEGQLPKELSNCFNLEILDIGSNRIVDTFPYWLRRLPNLSILLLRSNQLYGTIGDDNIVRDTKSVEEIFPSLQIIDLSSNNFSRVLKLQWLKQLKSMMSKYNSSGETIDFESTESGGPFYQYSIELTYKGILMTFERMLTTVTLIDFSNNRLEGTIPEALGSLVSLRILNLSHNTFTGKIPAQLGSIKDLESLDLSCNQLSGEIPQELTNLTFLEIMNLSNNNLVGRVPQSRQFSTFDISSFGGNPGLCGLPLLELPCGSSLSPYTPSAQLVHRSSTHSVDVVLFLFIGLGFGVGFAAAIVVEWNRVNR
uniref:non-specific serine/threonine protein kinase n=1 Tax=Zea mays TaxID=4577 RepID=A0A804RKC2_MAIZE